MRISKEKSAKLANILLKSKQEKLQNDKKEVAEKIYNYLYGNLNEKLKEAFENEIINKYLIKSDVVYLVGNGFNYKQISLYKSLPTTSQYNGLRITLEGDFSKKIQKKYQEIDKKEKDIKEAYLKLSNSIYSLGTEKRILEVFPELQSEFEVKKTSEIINIKELRNLIK